MSRKNLLASLTERKLTAVNPSSTDTVSPTSALERNRNRGAFGAITRSIDELAEKAEAAKAMEARLLEGASIIELDPELVEASFVADRMGDDEAAFNELLEAIREQGQDSPILVRPHPGAEGRYMIVFGHRRHRVARALGRKVRAVVKDLADQEHVIAQGQENSARADLSFIEKAVFASSLERNGYDRDVIMQALAVDKSVVSKMISVTSDIPAGIIEAVGPARNSGRDRWYRLAIKCRDNVSAAKAAEVTSSAEFRNADSDERLSLLTSRLEGDRTRKKAVARNTVAKPWAPRDKSVSVTARPSAKGFSLDLTEKEARPFGQWISSNLDSLYEAFRKSEKTEQEN
ncbi:ParB family chromosome partitioning protein [Aquamicrobium ahrensii]|uniref:ParB family chromosome partitioning protein n=2 Tax=Aquamicrobium ahrensii TaxID=469551 RepID=A0ABV2KQS4_9HYPH